MDTELEIILNKLNSMEEKIQCQNRLISMLITTMANIIGEDTAKTLIYFSKPAQENNIASNETNTTKNETNNNQTKTENITKPLPKTQEIQYDEHIGTYFKSQKYTYNTTLTVSENFDILAYDRQTEYTITDNKNKKIFYKTQQEYNNKVHLYLTKDKLYEKSNNSIKNLQFINATPDGNDMTQVNKLFDIKSKSVNNATKLIINKTLSKVGINEITDIETNINMLVACSPCYLKNDKDLYIENGVSLDINSHHPSILIDENFRFPIRQHQKPQMITKINNTNDIAIYVLKVDKNDMKNKIPWFTQKDNKENKYKIFYTNYMVQLFDKLNVKYELFDAGIGFNCIKYSNNDTKTGNEIFGESINLLYKNRNNKTCKAILQQYYGNLIQIKYTDDEYVDENTDIQLDVDNVYDGNTVTKNENGFMLDIARMKIFMFDFMKLDMYNKFIENKPEVLRIKTDSILYNVARASATMYNATKETIDEELKEHIGYNIGQLKHEGIFHNITYPHVNVSFKSEIKNNKFINSDDSYAKFYNKETLEFE